jgi:hypothetical protein
MMSRIFDVLTDRLPVMIMMMMMIMIIMMKIVGIKCGIYYGIDCEFEFGSVLTS